MTEKVIVKIPASLGLLDVVGIVFIVLKLLDIITWSWWWVLAPFWLPLVAAIVVFLGVLFFSWILGTL